MALPETAATRQAGHFCVPHLATHLWIDTPPAQPPPAAVSRPLSEIWRAMAELV